MIFEISMSHENVRKKGWKKKINPWQWLLKQQISMNPYSYKCFILISLPLCSQIDFICEIYHYQFHLCIGQSTALLKESWKLFCAKTKANGSSKNEDFDFSDAYCCYCCWIVLNRKWIAAASTYIYGYFEA